MTTWLEIANGDVDQDSPVTQPLMTGLRDNVRAAAEAATGAPINSAVLHPYDKVNIGDGADGLLYDFSVDGVVGSVETPAFEAGYSYVIIGRDVSHNFGSPANLLVQGWNGSSWVAISTIATSVAAATLTDFNATVSGDYLSGGDITDLYEKARVVYNNGSIDAGIIYLWRNIQYGAV